MAYLICLHSFAPKIKLESHERVWEKKEFCGICSTTQKNNILNQKIKKKIKKQN